MDQAFYQECGEGRFRSSEHTNGPWGPGAQHLGPPSALLVRALESVPGSANANLARVTVEILGAVPVAELGVSAQVERPGRSVELLSATLTADQRPVALARAWRIVTSDTSPVRVGAGDTLPPPDSASALERPDGWHPGYLDAMEWRSVRGGLDVPGPATVWARQRVALVAGEAPSPLQRLFTVADSGNGASATLEPTRWWFINTELTVHVHRLPEGEWIGLDAATTVGPHGVGTANSVLHDVHGPVATGAQALMIRPR